jgi:uncharacterized protein
MKNSILRYSTLILLLFSVFQISGCKTTTLDDPPVTGSTAASGSGRGHQFHSTNQPRQIALLLPVSGNHADSSTSIREGFFAGFYQSNSSGAKPNIRVYDTNTGNVQNTYRQAVEDGADFVVGPLAKEEVRQLSMMPASQLKAPVLALNTHPSARQASSNFVQFSLAPEAEAEQIAEKARQLGYQTAGIIVPDNAWGKRIASAFSNHWQRQGGTVRSTVYSNPSQDQSAAVRRLLGVKEPSGEKRRSGPKDPMQDKPQIALDFIMMAAPPDQARQLKPLFGFYFADNIPVLATSSIYGGSPNAARDSDLNGILFLDMPSMLNPQRTRELQSLAAEHGSKQSNQSNRLFAMGLDAYALTNRPDVLQGNGQYAGATGNLSLGANNELERQLQWAKFRGGVPTPL